MEEVLQLNQQNLQEIAKLVPCPSYDRTKLKAGIVHIGIGGFHRSHQAYYIHQLLEKFGALDWGICGVGIREADRKMYEVLKKQDGLYTLIIQHPDGEIASEVIGSIKQMLLAVDHPNKVIEKIAHVDTKIVSLTITEGGYNFNPQTDQFNFDNKAIQHEINHPTEPQTVFGYVTAALRKRKAEGLPAFSILSCDNIPHNGSVARKMLLAFAQKQDPSIAEWIENKVSFPNTMVDRITPVSSSSESDYLRKTYQINDDWPVICEPFIQWVVEDNFIQGRPPLEQLDVQFVPNVIPYEKMKIRLLNAGHSVLGIPGALHGHASINDCMNDPVFSKFMRAFMDKEATPILDPIEGIDLDTYKDSLEKRFANPNIKDHVSRICSESSAKLPKFLIPTIQDNLSKHQSIEYATLIIAAWCYYSDKEKNEKDEALEIIDEQKVQLNKAASLTSNDSLSFIRMDEIFGNLIENERFTSTYTTLLRKVYTQKDIRSIIQGMIER